jgi:hypothetical protein
MPTQLNPDTIFERGLHAPQDLSSAQRLVFLLMHLEALMDMEGWDHFFTSRRSAHYYPELKQGLTSAGDLRSLEVLEDYERHLAERNVALDPHAIDTFLTAQDENYFKSCRDWREHYSQLSEERWDRVARYLRTLGFELQT